MANAADPYRYEIARIYTDVVNWNMTGSVEVNLYEKYWSAGLKKSYVVSYGYTISPRIHLKDMSGVGSNNFRVAIGPEVVVNGTIKYIPIYADVRYWSRVNVELHTNAQTTTNSSNTSQGYLYYNQSPAGSSIADFAADDVVTLANSAGSTILSGHVGIGTSTPDEKLTVAGKIHSQEVKVTVNAGADFVFQKDYHLKPLSEVEKYISENQHLPEIASADEMKKSGLELGEMNIKLLQKVEELTLHLIEQNKLNSEQNKRIAELEQQLKK